METPTSRDSEYTKNWVGFQVGNTRFAVDIFRVREIVNPLPIVTVPNAPKIIVGVADHRGEVIPVIELRERFGLPQAPQTRRSKWIIVSTVFGDAGLIVDAITDVFGVDDLSERVIPKAVSEKIAKDIVGVYAYDGSLVFVLDLDRIGSVVDQLDIEEVKASLSEAPQARLLP